MPEKILRAKNPLDIREDNYQAETKQRKAYVVESLKMPDITLQTNVGERTQDRVGSIPSVSKASFRAAAMTDEDETTNMHDKFVQ